MKNLRGLIIDLTLELLFFILGFWLLWLNFYGTLGFGSDVWALWNKRLLYFSAIFLISLGTAFVLDNDSGKVLGWRRFRFFLISFLVLTAISMILGGQIGLYDAYSGGEALNFNTLWITFDVGSETGGYWGINVKLIADSIATILPLVMIVIGAVQLYYAGDASEYIKAILEIAVVLGALVVYGLFVAPIF